MGYTKKCLDNYMAPSSMAGFGLWLPLETFGLVKPHVPQNVPDPQGN